jgi:hypothetical protein
MEEAIECDTSNNNNYNFSAGMQQSTITSGQILQIYMQQSFILSYWSRCGSGKLPWTADLLRWNAKKSFKAAACRLRPTVNQRPIFTAWSTHLDSEERIDDFTLVYYLLVVDILDSALAIEVRLSLCRTFCVLCVVPGKSTTSLFAHITFCAR